MKNGTLFNRLVLVDSSKQRLQGEDSMDDAAMDYPGNADDDAETSGESGRRTQNTLLVFMAVSIACTTAAIAAGSYAVWLARQQAARQVLTDVNDILKSCQSRMQQLESDVQRRPG